MASKKFDNFKDLKKGKYDWKVPARVLNLWRGYTKKGEPFKAFNLLLLDPQRCRIHAFVPSAVADDIERKVEVGKIFVIENFTVKDYKIEEKFRCIRKPFQIVFGPETVLKHLEENIISIERCWFDFYDLEDLKPLAKQNTYLIDVVGVMEEHDPIGKVKNKHGQIQSQFKFNITDGRTSVKVTFWDEFAQLFADVIQRDLEHPLIVILGSCRVTMWDDEVILANVGATTFYLNYNHHSVTELRKRCSQPNLWNRTLSTPKNRIPRLYKVKDIKNLEMHHVETEVMCQIQILMVHQIKSWCHPVCTSCYERIERVQDVHMCTGCNRVVPYADMRFEIYTTASDETAEIKIMLEDREVRNMIGKTVFQLLDEGNKEDNWPTILQTIQHKEYTVKIYISEENIQKTKHFYVATDIMEGFNLEARYQHVEENHPHPISYTEPQASGSSYHLESYSNFN